MTTNFDEFINLNDDIDNFIELINKIDWFNNCGNKYSEELAYNYTLEENIEVVKKNIIRSNNYAGIITTVNLFEEANHRIYCYLRNNQNINLSLENLKLNSWVNLREKINKRLNKTDFSHIDDKYSQKFGLKKPLDRFPFRLSSAIMEVYCKKHFPETPTFFDKILKIYEDGHIITGWKGKFPSPYLFVDKPIDNKKGTLIIW